MGSFHRRLPIIISFAKVRTSNLADNGICGFYKGKKIIINTAPQQECSCWGLRVVELFLLFADNQTNGKANY